MIMWATGLGMGVGRFLRPLRGVKVLAMPHAGLDSTPGIESVCGVPLGAGVLWLLVSGMVVGVIIYHCCSSRDGGSHLLSDICKARIVQWRWRGGVLTLHWRGYRTPSLRGIPLASQHGNVARSRGKLRIPRRTTLLLILTICKTSNV